jgi:AraC family transcriptional regulator, arabinose operon regulatory protein
MKILNYLKLNEHPIQLRLVQNRTHHFTSINHGHQGMELLYIHKGKGKVIINQQIFPIDEGTLVVFKPFQLHQVQIETTPFQPYIRSLFVFEPEILERFLSPFPSLLELLQSMCFEKDVHPIFKNNRIREIEKIINTYQGNAETNSPAEKLEQQALLLISLLAIIKPFWNESIQLQDEGTAFNPSTVEQIMEWINQHFMVPFELKKLAESVHLSPVHVSSLFRKHIGTSITDYLTARRIREACWLLKTTDLSVKEIGESIGLTNFSYFCQLFKKNIGLSPHQYRKNFFTSKIN